MTYPRNAASPPPFVVGQVVLIADGSVQTTGVSARVQIGTGSWTSASGTLTADATSGFWTYTPTQSETNADSFSVVIYKSSCIGDGRTVITSASATSGYIGTDQGKITNASSVVNLSGTTIKSVTDAVALPSSASINITGNITGNVSGSVGSVTGSVGSVTSPVTAGTVSDKTGYSLVAVTGLGNQTANITGNVSGSVGSVTSPVTVGTNNDKTGYSLTQAFPANFSSLAITVGGAVTAGTVSDKTGYSLSQAFPSNFASLSIDVNGKVLLQPTQTGVTIPTVTSVTNAVALPSSATINITGNISGSVGSVTGSVGSVTNAVTVGTINANTITSSSIAASALNGKGDWNIGKTGYALTQAFPTNFSSFAIAAGTGAVTVNGDAFGNTFIITNLASQSSVNTLTGYVDTEVAAIKAKTDNLPASPASVSDITNAMSDIKGSGWSSSTDTLHAIRSASGGSGNGARAVTITVRDSSAAPIQSASVRLSRAGETYLQTTNGAGDASFSVDDGNWYVSITAAGFGFTPVSLAISANTSQTYVMSATGAVSPPPFAGLCNVLFAVIHLGNPVQNASVVATLEDENPTVDNYLISRQVTSGVTDASGYCVLTMVQYSQFTRGGVYRIKVADSLGRIIHDRKVKVPSESTANAEDLIDAR